LKPFKKPAPAESRSRVLENCGPVEYPEIAMEKTATSAAPKPGMKLPPQLFAEILSVLRKNDSDANAEKRRTTRMAVWAKLSVHVYDGKTLGRQIMVLARDLSMEGIGVLSGVEMKRDDMFVGHLPRTATHTCHLIFQAVFVGRMADGLYNVGCRFIGEMPADQAAAAPPKPAA
jgi:hypothetical protein